MRKSALILLAIIILLSAVIAFFARDRYLERAFESGLELVAGAQVEVDRFHFSLFKLECSWQRLQIANKNNPWFNIIETGPAVFDIEFRPLFWKRVIIKEMRLTAVRSGTRRLTDGSLPQAPEEASAPASEEPGMSERAIAALQKQLGDIPGLNLAALGKNFKIDSLVNLAQIATVQQYQHAREAADSSFNYWQGQLKPDAYTRKVQELEVEIKALQLDKIDDLPSLLAALKKIEQLYQEITTLKKQVEEQYQGLNQAVDHLQQELKDLQTALKADIERVQKLAQLKELEVKDISLILFGKPLVGQVENLLGYVNLGRKYLPTAQKLVASPKVEKPPRFKGQDIHFPFHYRYPRFLIRTAQLSGATAAGDTARAYFLNGLVRGITNEPRIYGRPTRFDVDLARVAGNAYQLAGSLDHTTNIAYDSLWFTAENWALGRLKLAESKYFPQAVRADKGAVKLAGFFIDDQIDLSLNFAATPIYFDYQPNTNKIAEIVRQILSALTALDLQVQLLGQKKDYEFRMQSNVDRVLAQSINNLVQANIQKARLQVENYLQNQVNQSRSQAEGILNKYQQQLLAKMDQARQQVQAKFSELEAKKKELQDRIEAEKDKVKKKTNEQRQQVEDKAKKKLDQLLKKPKNP